MSRSCLCSACSWDIRCQETEQRDVKLVQGGEGRHRRRVLVSWASRACPVTYTCTWIVTLISRMYDFGPRRTQRLPLPTHCTQRQLQCGVRYRKKEYWVLGSSIVQLLVKVYFNSVEWRIRPFPDGISQWTQPCFNKMVPDLTPYAVLSFLHDVFEGIFLSNRNLSYLRKSFYGHQSHWT